MREIRNALQNFREIGGHGRRILKWFLKGWDIQV
jgi:hypothetical protein